MMTGVMSSRRSYSPLPLTLKVRRARKGAGLGLWTESQIPKNACIIEYVGRPISREEEMKSKSRYLFTVTRNLTIDGTMRSNIARYINHSCKPNAEATIYKNRVYIFSLRPIKAGEEITYDYGKEYFDEYLSKGRCRCDSCVKR